MRNFALNKVSSLTEGSAIIISYIIFFRGPLSLVLILKISFLFRSNASSVL